MLRQGDLIIGSPKNPITPPWPPLADDVIELRPWELRDAPGLAAAWTDPDIVRFSDVPAERTVRDAETWIGGSAFRRSRRISIDFVVSTPANSTVMGEVGLWNFDEKSNGAMLGYWLHKTHRNQGYASRSVKLIVDWAMAPAPEGLGLSLLVAKVARDNAASEKLLRSLGFHLERNDTDGHRLFTLRA